ncbi:hypothetical protein NT2_02_04440 [Caenibius tardaugens NBRC 16725]|uniref:DNA binding HTH domain-containing protein n=1 Tax=Caenibius tardaugens NBRC 16725 TaxID=1219035 RepID=U2Y5G9_9SPHN|nr:hypothetical protein [Caenibius tardaugens]AZI34833.1 hypothetical protein EGO55_01765 [Caenibius tardaugens NBRC 16725]GAD48361.1 hypothetical protein NT2_02_04440 [Caenibius tardaugens NBRC 16725]
MFDRSVAPGGAFALEALAVGALVFVAGRGYRLDSARRFVRAAEADVLAGLVSRSGDDDGASGPVCDGRPLPGDVTDWRNFGNAGAEARADHPYDADPEDDAALYDAGDDPGAWAEGHADGDDEAWGDEDWEDADAPDGQVDARAQARRDLCGVIAARARGAGAPPSAHPGTSPSAHPTAQDIAPAAMPCATPEGIAVSTPDTPPGAVVAIPESPPPALDALPASLLDLPAWDAVRQPVPLSPSASASTPEGGHLAFSPAKRVRFAEALAETGNVRHACAVAGISRHTAYKARRRDAVLAQAWDAALVLAADHVDAVVAERALDGVEEPVFWKGELVGTRRRYDNRLLLAHLARLEARAAHRPVALAAGRFDELLARLGGQPVDPALLRHCPTFMEGGLPVYPHDHVPGLAIPRDEWCDHAVRHAEETAAMRQTGDPDYDWSEAAWEDCTGEAAAVAEAEARERWDTHRAAAWAYVDALAQTPEEDAGNDQAGKARPAGMRITWRSGGDWRKAGALNCVTPVTPAVSSVAGGGRAQRSSRASLT